MRLGIRRYVGHDSAMKKQLAWLFLVLFSASLLVGCGDEGDMTSPPANTNAPASTNK
jgi:predicted small lipoprotein YifL